MNETIFYEISRILRELTSEKPWMTATGLSRKIKTLTGHEFPPSRIEKILIAHSQSPKRVIRYSYYPSKKTLDILWGHVEVVKENQNLPKLYCIEDPAYEQCESVPENARWFFVSHNYRDFGDVLQLQRLISKHKYGAWLFETNISKGAPIMSSVKEAIEECAFFLLYVTRRSIGSLWVQKEIEGALRSNDCEVYVVVDGRDKDLLQLFEDSTGEGEAQEFCSAAAQELSQSSHSDWASRCKKFVDKLGEYVEKTNKLLIYPTLPENIRWRGKWLKIQPFEEFLTTIVEYNSA